MIGAGEKGEGQKKEISRMKKLTIIVVEENNYY